MDTKVKKLVENLILAAEGVCLFVENEHYVKCLNAALNDLKKASLEVQIDRA